MFKKFLTVFVLCIGIFGTSVFAAELSTVIPDGLPTVSGLTNLDGVEGKYWVLVTEISKPNSYVLYYSVNPFISNGVDSLLIPNNTVVYSANIGDKNWSSGGFMTYNYNVLKSYKFFNTSHKIGNGNDVFFSPMLMSISEMVKPSLGNLTTAFGANSLILSAVGVIILSLVLVPSLVRRLMALFL